MLPMTNLYKTSFAPRTAEIVKLTTHQGRIFKHLQPSPYSKSRTFSTQNDLQEEVNNLRKEVNQLKERINQLKDPSHQKCLCNYTVPGIIAFLSGFVTYELSQNKHRR